MRKGRGIIPGIKGRIFMGVNKLRKKFLKV